MKIQLDESGIKNSLKQVPPSIYFSSIILLSLIDMVVKIITISLQPKVLEKLDAMSTDKDISRSKFLSRLVEKTLGDRNK